MSREVSTSAKLVYGSNKILSYCMENSTAMTSEEKQLIENTLKHPMCMMLGSLDCLKLYRLMLKSMGAKKIIEVGIYTGLSTMMLASALGPGGKVLACDITDEFLNFAGAKDIWKRAGVTDKIDLKLGNAVETLQKALDEGEGGTYDFVYIDADKSGYDAYYELSLKLLRTGGMIALDNTLWSGKVVDDSVQDSSTKALRAITAKASKDARVECVTMDIGDGVCFCTKL